MKVRELITALDETADHDSQVFFRGTDEHGNTFDLSVDFVLIERVANHEEIIAEQVVLLDEY